MRFLVSLFESISVTLAMIAGVCLAAGLVALVCLKLEGLGLVTMSFVFGIPSAAGLFTCKSVRGRLEQRQSVRGFPVIMKEEAE